MTQTHRDLLTVREFRAFGRMHIADVHGFLLNECPTGYSRCRDRQLDQALRNRPVMGRGT